VNAAGLRFGTPSFYPIFDVAPGESITIFGSAFDAGTRVFFDGIPAPVIYRQADQINAVVPFEVVGPTTAITLQGSGLTTSRYWMCFDANIELCAWFVQVHESSRAADQSSYSGSVFVIQFIGVHLDVQVLASRGDCGERTD
jgi:uncharacterized protein (TIGR03437 family)